MAASSRAISTCISKIPIGHAGTTDAGNESSYVQAMSVRVHRGDLYWIQEDEHAHPHLVVQDDVFNHARITTVVVCALTTNLHRAGEPGNVLLDVGEGDLPKQSVVVVSQISSVEKTRLGARIGSLSQERVEQVLSGLRFQQTAFFGDR